VSVAVDTPIISFITTSKGRLSSLRQSLPRMLAQPRAEVIVVDYDCPESSGDWVAAQYPAARVVRIRDRPVFNAARARNLGGRAARGQWFCFMDAEGLLIGDFVEQLLPLLRDGAFFTTSGMQREAFGTVVCRGSDYLAVDGYDEVLEGWGTEDRDFYIRLNMLGRSRQTLPEAWVTAIGHGDDLRVQYHEMKDLWLGQRINAMYAQIKHDLARQLDKIIVPLEVRRAVYEEVRRTLRRAAESGQYPAGVEIRLPADLVVRLYGGWQMTRVWTYELHAPPRQPADAPGAPVPSQSPGGQGQPPAA
jgi:glycosyltransferase involved in cell wall biosynthesis